MSAAESGKSAVGGDGDGDEVKAEVFDGRKADSQFGCLTGVYNSGAECRGFLSYVKHIGKRMQVEGIDDVEDVDGYLQECERTFAAKRRMPLPASDCISGRRFREKLDAERRKHKGFKAAVDSFIDRIEDVYSAGRCKLRRLLATNGESFESAVAGALKLVENDELDEVNTMFHAVRHTQTPKERHVFRHVIYEKFGQQFRVYDSDSKQLLNAEQFAVKMGNVEVLEIIRQLTEDPVTAEARRITLEAAVATAKGLQRLRDTPEADFPKAVLKCLAEKRTIDAMIFKAAVIRDAGISQKVIDALKKCIRSGKSVQVAYALRTAAGVLSPTVYIPVCAEAEAVAKDLHLREDISEALAGDVSTDEAKAAYLRLRESDDYKSTDEAFRGKWHHGCYRTQCTRKVDLDLTDSCGSGRSKPSDDYEFNIDAAIVDPLFKAAMYALQEANSALSGALLTMGDPKDSERLRTKGIDVVRLRCTLTFEDVYFLENALLFLRGEWREYDEEEPEELVEGKVNIYFLSLKNAYRKLTGPKPDKYADAKINVLIRTLVKGRKVTIIGEVRLSANGMNTYKSYSHDFYAITRQSDLYKAAALQMAGFSMAKLNDGSEMQRLVDANYTETNPKQRTESWLKVAGCASASHCMFETLTTKWFAANAFECLPTEVVDNAFDLILSGRCNRRDFAETLKLIPEVTFQKLLRKSPGFPFYAPVVRYCQRVVHFKAHIADMLIPTELPEAEAKWPMGATSRSTALQIVASACARFGARANRVEYVKAKLPLPTPKSSSQPLSDPLTLYRKSGGRNEAVISALTLALE